MAAKTFLTGRWLAVLIALMLLLLISMWWWPVRTVGPSAIRPEEGVLTDPLLAPHLGALADAVDARSWDDATRAALGMAYEANELYGPAQLTWDQLHRLDATDWRWSYRMAMTTDRLGDLDAAIAMMKHAASTAPAEIADPWWRLAMWSIDVGDLPAAEAALAKARAIDADALPVRLADVRLQLAAGDGAKAEKLITTHHLFRDVSSGYVWHLKSQALRQQGRLEEASQMTAQSDSRRPRLDDVFRLEMAAAVAGLRAMKMEASSHAAAGAWPELLQSAQQVLQYEPDDRVHQRLYGIALARTGDAVAGEEVLAKLFNTSKDSATCTALASTRVALYQQQKNQRHLDAAIDAALVGLATSPDDRGLLMVYGRASAMSGRYRDAFEAFHAAWNLDRTAPHTLELAVKAADQADLWEDAIELSKTLYASNADHPLAGPGYALGLIRIGEYEQAQQILANLDRRRVRGSLLRQAHTEVAPHVAP